MSTPVSHHQTYQINNRLDGNQVFVIQRGIRTDSTVVSSMRESAQAEEAPSFLCGCFTSLLNWIGEIFLSCFGSRASQIQAAPPRATTCERAIQKVDRFIDAQFDEGTLTFPLKVFVTLRFNNQILAMPRSDVAASLTEFKAEAKRVLRQVLQTQNLEGENQLLDVETHFLNNTSPHSPFPLYAMTASYHRINLITGTQVADTENEQEMGFRRIEEYFNIHTHPNAQLLQESLQFLFC